jgi:hypothetical protein
MGGEAALAVLSVQDVIAPSVELNLCFELCATIKLLEKRPMLLFLR